MVVGLSSDVKFVHFVATGAPSFRVMADLLLGLQLDADDDTSLVVSIIRAENIDTCFLSRDRVKGKLALLCCHISTEFMEGNSISWLTFAVRLRSLVRLSTSRFALSGSVLPPLGVSGTHYFHLAATIVYYRLMDLSVQSLLNIPSSYLL